MSRRLRQPNLEAVGGVLGVLKRVVLNWKRRAANYNYHEERVVHNVGDLRFWEKV